MKKRLLSILLALCMVLTLLPAQAMAAEMDSEESLLPVVENEESETLGEAELSEEVEQDDELPDEWYTDLEASEEDSKYTEGQSEHLDNEYEDAIYYEDVGFAEELSDIVESGNCGVNNSSNVTWVLYSDGTLVISGSGRMGDYNFAPGMDTFEPAPWWYCAEKIQKVVIEEGVRNIGSDAFNPGPNISQVSIPGSVVSISSSVFSTCPSLQKISVDSNNSAYISVDEVLFSKDMQSLLAYPRGSDRSSYNIPLGVSIIASNAFSYCRNLTNVTFPNSIVAIRDHAFSDCENLSDIILPNSPATIEGLAFRNCTGLTSITVPEGIAHIDGAAFSGCPNLCSISVHPSNAFYASIDGVLFNKDITTLVLYPGKKEDASYTIPSTVTVIGNSMYIGCCFDGATNLMHLVIPDSVEDIRTDFSGCTNLTSITIPINITNITYGMFGNCTKLSDVYYSGSQEQWKKISIDAYNEPLKKATIHYGTISPDPDPSGMASITSLYPANNSTIDISYGTATFRIGFDRVVENGGGNRAALDFSVGTFTVYRASDNTKVYEVKESSFTEDVSIDVVLSGTTEAPSVFKAITVSGIIPKLDYDTEYYVTMPAGFVKFEDGTVSPAIEKGEWIFTTSKGSEGPSTVLAKPYNGDFWFSSDLVKDLKIGDRDRNSLKYLYYYNDSWFFESSLTYQHKLTQMSLRAAMAAFDTGTDDRARNIKQLLHDLDFSYTEESIHYPKPEYDSIGYAIGSKNISTESGESCSLVLVAIRGAGYGIEWGGNFHVGTGDDHAGFGTATAQVMEGLKKYIDKNKVTMCSEIKIWVVGYSRAGATANLLAKQLDNGAIKDLQQKDIYAFCFECPQNSVGARFVKSDTKYANIVNIVNPIDFVPKVAMSRWGYGRYGTTYYLPSKESTKDYKILKNHMISVYADILTKNNDGSYPYTPAEYWAEASGQASILDEFMNNLSDEFVSAKYYTYNHEVNLMEIASRTLGKEGGIVANPGAFGAFIVELIDLCSLLKSHPINTASTIYLFTANGGYAGLAHYPELCLSWIDSLNGATEGEGYRKIFINCPVDITVRDSQNQLVAQIDNNVIQEIEDGVVSYIDDDGQKVIILPTDENYTVEMSATDNGTVTYTATEYNYGSASTEKIVGYYEIDVKKGDILTGMAENLDEVDSANYPLTLNNKPLTPTVTQSGSSVQEFEVNVTASGNGTVIGGGYYVSGEFAKVTATANSGSSFLGWYVNNTFVSSDAEYRFLVNKNIEIVARFTENTSPVPSVPSTPNSGGSGGGSSKPSVKPSATPTTPTAPSTPMPSSIFSDVPSNHTFATEIAWARDNGIMSGYSDGTFRPNNTTNRQQMWMVLGRMAGAYPANMAEARTWAINSGISDGTNPENPMSRQQMVAMLYRFAQFQGVTISGTADISGYPDSGLVADYAKEALAWAVGNGIIMGTTDGRLNPEGTATRAHLAAFLYRYSNL